MPRALSENQRMLVETLIQAKIPPGEIAIQAKCSVSQVKKMKRNKRGFGTVVRPKLKKQGRPRALTQEMVEVHSSPIILQARIINLGFRLL
jgi:hypothetical protein